MLVDLRLCDFCPVSDCLVCKIVLLVMCVFRLPFVGTGIWLFICRLFARSAFEAFRRTCESARTGELEERRNQNKNLYGFILERLAQVGLTTPAPTSLVSTVSSERETEKETESYTYSKRHNERYRANQTH